jgi:hypothetical protein
VPQTQECVGYLFIFMSRSIDGAVYSARVQYHVCRVFDSTMRRLRWY